MFTGLIEELGTLVRIDDKNGGRVLRMGAGLVLDGLVVGDSVSINGVCQTVTGLGTDWFEVEAVGDTLRKAMSIAAQVSVSVPTTNPDREVGHLPVRW